jgi:hypothetical protein
MGDVKGERSGIFGLDGLRDQKADITQCQSKMASIKVREV